MLVRWMSSEVADGTLGVESSESPMHERILPHQSYRQSENNPTDIEFRTTYSSLDPLAVALKRVL